MKILFDFDFENRKHLNIPCNLPITVQDRLDGLTDTVSFEFMYDADLMLEYHKHQKAVLKIYEDETSEEVFKEYRMVISDLSRDTNTMYMNNNAPLYTYTCTLVEPTVLIDENIRTDIAITPYLYPKQSNGKYPYETLFDAYNKICSSHNLNNRNEKLYSSFAIKEFDTSNKMIDVPVIYSSDEHIRLNIHFKAYSHRDTQTYVDDTGQQKIRIVTTEIPSTTLNITEFPHTFNVTCTKTTGGINGGPDIVTTTPLSVTLDYDEAERKIEITMYGQNKYTSWNGSVKVYQNEESEMIYRLLSNVACPSLTYVDMSTYDQLSDIFDRIGAVPYLDYDSEGKCYVTLYLKQGYYKDEIKTLTNLSTEEVARPSDMYANTISSQITNMVCDDDLIIYPSLFSKSIMDAYATEPEDEKFSKTISVTLDKSMNQVDAPYVNISEGEAQGAYYGVDVLVPNGLDSKSQAIGEGSSYFVQLPTNIEYIERIYLVERANDSGGRDFKLTPISKNRVVEYSVFQATQDSQKHYFAYYVRGENKIKQIAALTTSKADVDEDWKWSSGKVFTALRKSRFVVVYKPMMDTNYTSYSYNDIKSKTTKYVDLPYKIVSDKQASNLLSYELEKYNSNKILFNQVGLELDELNHFAGERVFYKGKRFLNSYYKGEFNTYQDLVGQYNTNLYNVDKNFWAKVNGDIYTIDNESNKWIKYVGEQCVITKISYTIYNTTISASYELSNKVAYNSSVSGYADNIRISDNLSSENVVNRNLQLYKTVLLNGVVSDNVANNPSLVSNKSAPYLKTIDTYIVPNALNQLGMCSYATEQDKTTARTYIVDLNKVAFNIKTDAIVDTTVWNPNYWYTQETQTFSTQTDFVNWLVNTYDTSSGNYPYFSYDSSDSSVTAYRIFKVNGELLIPDRMFDIPHDFSNDADYAYRYAWNQSDTGANLIELQYKEYDSPMAMWNTVSFYNMSRFTYPVTLEIGMLSQSDSRTTAPKFACQYNTIWQNSNTITNVSMYNQDPAIIGYYADGTSGGETFARTMPLFYNTSDSNDAIYSVGNYNLQLFEFKKLLEGTGYDDLNIDLREFLSCNIQYLILPNNSNDFRTNHYLREFGDYYRLQFNNYPFYGSNFINIKELNNNIQWFSHIQNFKDVNTSVGVYKIKKGTTLNDYLLNINSGTPYTYGSAKIHTTGINSQDGTLYTPSIKITFQTTINNDTEYDYVLQTSNGVPLFLFSTEGCEDTNSIILTTFTI